MQNLTDAETAKLRDVARRNDVSLEAASVVLDSLVNGDGQAQFNHPDLGGMGQWSRGGMVMVGDMFNARLKARVDQLCTDLSDLLRDDDLVPTQGRDTNGGNRGGWWPTRCGTPSSSGSQNGLRYAYFPETSRLAIERDGAISLYDTGDHRINGVSQQQSGTQDLAFTSPHGRVDLHELKRLDRSEKLAATNEPPPPEVEPAATPAASTSSAGDDVFATIERLHGLQQKGILSEVEFAEKKKELLARL